MYDLLKTIDDPAALRRLDRRQLRPARRRVARLRARQRVADGRASVSNLGTVELTIALHYVFDTPRDRIVWMWVTKPIRTRS